MKRIYLDNAATTPVSPTVIEAMTKALKDNFGNPSSIHSEGRTSRALIEESRKIVANTINASIGEIFFTSGGTESNNMAIKCAIRDLGVTRFITSPTEHHCILHTLEHLDPALAVTVEFLIIDKKGRISADELKQLLGSSKEKTMVSLMHSNNEIGTMIDLHEIAGICEEFNVLFHTDTVQTIGYFPIDVSTTKISFLSGSAHKFYGPKGCGFIYINGDNMIKPFIDGGSQERNMRGGTENISGITGLAKALKESVTDMDIRKDHISNLRNYMIQKLSADFEGLIFNGDYDGRFHYKVLSIAFPPSPKSELLLLNLDIMGISASGGSACSSGAESSSHVLEALNLDPGYKTIRFSFSHNNTKEEIDIVIEKLKSILPEKVRV